jgi:hypothetical protein
MKNFLKMTCRLDLRGIQTFFAGIKTPTNPEVCDLKILGFKKPEMVNWID